MLRAAMSSVLVVLCLLLVSCQTTKNQAIYIDFTDKEAQAENG
ncbi:MAG: hypothetical protein K0Q75_2713 [Anaerospora sp.]|nr:hypothetical protein [Anaerospora sp.]